MLTLNLVFISWARSPSKANFEHLHWTCLLALVCLQVLTLNLVFICWALWQLKQCLAAEFRSFWAALGSKISTAKRRVRVFGGRQRVRLQGCFG